MVSGRVLQYYELKPNALQSLAVLCAGGPVKRHLHGPSDQIANLRYSRAQLEYGTSVNFPSVLDHLRTFTLQKPCYSLPLQW